MEPRRDDAIPIIPRSENDAQCVLRLLDLLPALKNRIDLSYSVMVGRHASQMIADQLPIGNLPLKVASPQQPPPPTTSLDLRGDLCQVQL